ncbi:MAG: glycosyltransferase family 4 protein [Chloroflexi bacterium]|nr:glycosyltransferase family 4 protein [Chloroflexota bacterium]
MRVLVLASYVPSFYKGAEIRLLHLLRHLSSRHEITLWAINRRGVPAGEIAALLPHCRLELQDFHSPEHNRLVARLRRSGWRQWLQQRRSPLPLVIDRIYRPALQARLNTLLASQHFDLIHVNQIMVWQYLPRPVVTPVLLCTDNAWADLAEQEWRAIPQWLPRRRKKAEAHKMRRYEKLAVESSDHCVVVSGRDGELIRQLAPATPISLIPNGVDTGYFRPAPELAGGDSPPRLVFTGAMGWPPNAEAMTYFCRDTLPAIRGEFPAVQMDIVGLQPPPDILALGQQPNIRVTGFVPDVRPYIAEATVYVVPLRQGSGTRLKILEALAMGKAVVSTTIGAEGLEVTDGRHLLIADEPQDFAARVCELLRDPSRRQALGQAGRTLVEACYDWRAIAAGLDAVYHQVRGQGTRQRSCHGDRG